MAARSSESALTGQFRSILRIERRFLYPSSPDYEANVARLWSEIEWELVRFECLDSNGR